MEEAKMVVNAFFKWNLSEGMFGDTLRFEFPLCLLDGDDDDSLREEVKDRFQDLVQALVGVRPNGIWFVDECADCRQRLGEDNICHNQSCPSYLEE